ncbi:GH32 C-terminal domain-containing protein [Lacticaseibacillus camelliae]|uniref:GH32 C-terminal domain-containing protein n=1 Tax=Lacticaseibacillus camelliae TaxID=381742 RepID=UPI0006D2833F|nr:GH32 C-terminal domain-containing protein [Lacticaseibacillus camelliae]
MITLTTAAHRSGQIRLGNAQESLSLTIDSAAQALTIDRTETGVPFALQYGTKRTVPLAAGPQRLQLWLDHSSFELSVANGQHFASGRIFPQVSAPWRMTADTGLVTAATGRRLNNMS